MTLTPSTGSRVPSGRALICVLLWFASISYTSSASAHEFWIEPQQSRLLPGDMLSATLHVGQNLKGNSYSYLPRRFVRFEHTINGETNALTGRIGDNPAIQIAQANEGLHIFSYQSTPDSLVYASAEKFADFVEYDGLSGVLEAHAARGLPEKGFKETYTRFAKALVQVGPIGAMSPQQDQQLGLKIELVALANPFALAAKGETSLPVRSFLDGNVLADVQIATFHRAPNGDFERRLTRSDADGMAKIDLTGGGFFLLSAVHMVEPGDNDFADNASLQQAVWHSLWASLTFNLPAF